MGAVDAVARAHEATVSCLNIEAYNGPERGLLLLAPLALLLLYDQD